MAGCAVYRERLVEAATGPVAPQALEQLTAHVAVCEGCRAEWEELCETVAWLREVPEPSVPPGFWEELDRRLRRATSAGRGPTRWKRVAGAAALAALAGLGALRWSAPPPLRSEARVVSPAVQALLPQVAELVQAWGAGMEGEGEPW